MYFAKLAAAALAISATVGAVSPAAAQTRYYEQEQFVPANPYTGEPAMYCQRVLQKKRRLFRSSKRRIVAQDCRPVRGGYRARPRYQDPYGGGGYGYDQSDGY